jgi:hypothetical protein
VRITVKHNQTKEEVMRAVDRTFKELFQGAAPPRVKIVEGPRSWQGSTLTFVLTTKLGWISTPIKGTIAVTDEDLMIDADLGMLEKMLPADAVREVVTSKFRGLLN